MKKYEWFEKGELVIILEKCRDENGKKCERVIGLGKIIYCEKTSNLGRELYPSYGLFVSSAKEIKTGKIYSSDNYSKIDFIKYNEYLKYLKDEKKRLLEEVKEIDEFIEEIKKESGDKRF